MAKFLKPFLDDLEKLKNGIQLNVRRDNRFWYGMIGNVVGDMPASNLMGGFKESAVFANKPCRICLVKRSEIDKIEQHERDCILRDQVTYKVHLSQVVDTESTLQQRTAFSVDYGIVGPSPFGELSYFDPRGPQLRPK